MTSFTVLPTQSVHDLCRTGTVDHQGVSIHYQDQGSPSDPPIFLIMGLGAQLTLWPEPLVNELIDAGYRVIRLDNRDIGLSGNADRGARIPLPRAMITARLGRKPVASYTLYHMVGDCIAVADHLKISSAHWVGASMGGMIVQLLAAFFPHRTASLTSIMSTTNDPRLPLPRADILMHMAGIGVKQGHDLDTVVERGVAFWHKISSPAYPFEEGLIRERLARDYQRSYRPAGFIRQTQAILATGGFAHHLKRISAPTQIIHGKDDPLVRVKAGMASAKAIPGAQLEIIKGMGHDLPLALMPQIAELIVYNAQRRRINPA